MGAWPPAPPPGPAVGGAARARTRSETLDDLARLDKAVALLGRDVAAHAAAIEVAARDERSRRPTVVAVVAVLIAGGGLGKQVCVDAGRAPTKGDLAEVRVEASTRSRDIEDRTRELERALADLRSELAALRAELAAAQAARAGAPPTSRGRR